MSERSRRLSRLLVVRKLTNTTDRAALEIALASLTAVVSGLGRQEDALAESREASRLALAAGDRSAWLLAEATGEAAGWNRSRLQPLLQSRETSVVEAKQIFLQSRREHEQVKVLVEDVQRSERTAEDRRSQHAADDWFLSKWTSSVD